jgi:hypothetical protein
VTASGIHVVPDPIRSIEMPSGLVIMPIPGPEWPCGITDIPGRIVCVVSAVCTRCVVSAVCTR